MYLHILNEGKYVFYGNSRKVIKFFSSTENANQRALNPACLVYCISLQFFAPEKICFRLTCDKNTAIKFGAVMKITCFLNLNTCNQLLRLVLTKFIFE